MFIKIACYQKFKMVVVVALTPVVIAVEVVPVCQVCVMVQVLCRSSSQLFLSSRHPGRSLFLPPVCVLISKELTFTKR